MPCVLSIFAFTNYISIDPIHSIVLSMSDAHVSGFKLKSGLCLALCILFRHSNMVMRVPLGDGVWVPGGNISQLTPPPP